MKPPRSVSSNSRARQQRLNSIQRMDEALERNTEHSNAVFIRQMRQAYFADVDALQKSGTVKIPK
jgi:hypothetical protein